MIVNVSVEFPFQTLIVFDTNTSQSGYSLIITINDSGLSTKISLVARARLIIASFFSFLDWCLCLISWSDSIVPCDVTVIVVPVLCVTFTGSEDSPDRFVSASFDTAICQTLPAVSRSRWACVQWEFTTAVRYSNCGIHNTTSNKKVMCPIPPTTVRRYIWHDRHTLPLPPADRTSLTSRHCQKRAEKATPIEIMGKEWAQENQSDRWFTRSTSIWIFQLSNPKSSACQAWFPLKLWSSTSLWQTATRP